MSAGPSGVSGAFRRGGAALLNHSSTTAWIILALSVLITIAAYYAMHDSVMRAGRVRFEAGTQDIRTAIQKRILEQEVVLWGGVGLFEADGDVSRRQWRKYVETLRLNRLLPGLQGFGFAEMVAPQDREAFVGRIRGEGFADFDIRPEGERGQYSSIIYLEPFRDRNLRAFGYDMYSEPTRRAAMELARDTGLAVLSGMVTLVQETDSDVQRGFLIYLPVYKRGMPTFTKEERRAAIRGFVYSPFRIGDLMQGILGKVTDGIEYRIFDGDAPSADRLLYDSSGGGPPSGARTAARFRHVETLWMGSHRWTLEFWTLPGFITSGEASQPAFIAAGGILIDVLLFLTISSLSTQRRRAQALARSMTSELRTAKERAESAARENKRHLELAKDANRRLEAANEGLMQFTSVVAHDLRAPLKRIESFVKILREEFLGGLGGEGVDIVERIGRGSSRMRLMLDSLHEYAKSSPVSIAGKITNLADMTRHAIDRLGEEARKADIAVLVQPDLSVRGDCMLLEQVMQNLIANSLKFRGANAPAIRIGAERAAGGRIALSVSDNGIGIEPRYAKKVFEMFARLHNDDEYPGTGIGLAICRKVVADHNGEIFVDTAFRGGTRIVIILDEVLVLPRSADEIAA